MDPGLAAFIDVRLIIESLIILYYIIVLIIFATSKKRLFRAPFYIVYIVTGVFDVMVAVATIYIRFHVLGGLGKAYELPFRIAASMTGSNNFTHMIGNMLTAIIQWSAVCMPHSFKSLWSTRNLALILTADVGICYAACSVLYFNPFTYSVVNGKERHGPRENPIAVSVFRYMSVAFGIVSTLISMGCLVKTTFVLRKLTSGERKARIREESIIVFILVSALVEALECGYEIIMLFDISTEPGLQAFLDEFFGYVFFVMMTMSPFTILLMSAISRKEVKRRCLVCIDHHQDGVTVDGTTGNPRVIRVIPSNTMSITPRSHK